MSFKQRKFKKRVKVENVEEDDGSDVEELSEQHTQILVETSKTRIAKVGSGIQCRSCHLCLNRKVLLDDSWTGVAYHRSLFYPTSGSGIVY